MADDDRDSPPPSRPPAKPVSDAWRDFMGLDSTQALILRVVRHRILFDAPQHLVDEIISDANAACLEGNKELDDLENPPAWVAGVTVNSVRLYFRRHTKHLRWLNREANVEEVAAEEIAPANVEAAEDTSPLDSIDAWLDKVVGRHPRDRQTLEILRHKARTRQTDEQLAAHFELGSVGALRHRVHYFKAKYEDRRQRWLSQRNRTFALFFKITAAAVAAVIIAVVAYWLLRGRKEGRLLPAPLPAIESPFGQEEGFPVGAPPPPEREDADAGGD